MNKPKTGDYNPFFQRYIDLIPDNNLVPLLELNRTIITEFFQSIPLEKHNFKYAENKWTIKEVLMHIIDTERSFSNRALICIRHDHITPLSPMDENFYASQVDVTLRSMEELIEEFNIVRRGFIMLYQHAEPEDLDFKGNSLGHALTARALAFIAAGHAIHHKNIISERYL
jgi:uncharacterized damage-inducible protein DinB